MHPSLVIGVVILVSNFMQATCGPPSPFFRSGGYPKFPGQRAAPSPHSGSNVLGCGERLVHHNPSRGNARIVGGSETPYGAYPWQVEVQLQRPDKRGYEHHCGGALLNDRLVLTAAHCLKEPVRVDQLRVVVGDHKLNVTDQFEQTVRVEKAILHPEFRQDGPYSNDIALMVLRPTMRASAHALPICLPAAGAKSAVGAWCVVSGWGAHAAHDARSISSVLRAASIPILAQDTCRGVDVLGGRMQPILDGMVCAGPLAGGVDACGGDSGGPLACKSNGRFVLNGLVSWGDGCAKRNRPGVYTRVAHYSNWIQDTAASLGLPPPSIG